MKPRPRNVFKRNDRKRTHALASLSLSLCGIFFDSHYDMVGSTLSVEVTCEKCKAELKRLGVTNYV